MNETMANIQAAYGRIDFGENDAYVKVCEKKGHFYMADLNEDRNAMRWLEEVGFKNHNELVKKMRES